MTYFGSEEFWSSLPDVLFPHLVSLCFPGGEPSPTLCQTELGARKYRIPWERERQSTVVCHYLPWAEQKYLSLTSTARTKCLTCHSPWCSAFHYPASSPLSLSYFVLCSDESLLLARQSHYISRTQSHATKIYFLLHSFPAEYPRGCASIRGDSFDDFDSPATLRHIHHARHQHPQAHKHTIHT